MQEIMHLFNAPIKMTLESQIKTILLGLGD